MDVRGLLFDLDDTLYDYAPCNAQGLEAAHKILQTSVEISFVEFMQLHDEARNYLAKTLHGQAALHNRVLFFKYIIEQLKGELTPALVSELYECYWQSFYNHMCPHPELHQVLEKLSPSYKMALVSNHTTLPQLKKIEILNISRFFPVVITSEEAGVEKPDPQIFNMALERLGVKAKESIFIGDSLRGDIEGAAQIGMRTIHTVEYIERNPESSPADQTIGTLADLLDIL